MGKLNSKNKRLYVRAYDQVSSQLLTANKKMVKKSQNWLLTVINCEQQGDNVILLKETKNGNYV